MASTLDLSKATYVVLTGASQGIGRSLAVEVAKLLGPNSLMVLLARNKDNLMQTASMCESKNVKVICTSIDLGKAQPFEMEAVLKRSLEGRNVADFYANIIFHNVGSLGNLTAKAGHLVDPQEIADYMTLNVTNVAILNSIYLDLFNDVEDRVNIVNITSLCAIKPMPGMVYYCSGKAAREMLFRVLAKERPNVRILNYSPGPVETAMIDCVILEAANDELRDVFTTFRTQGSLLTPEITSQKCMKVLLSGNYESGQHVDYFDDE